ncbi:MAG: cobalt transporter CbiM [Actinomycetota bacterium]|nr:cobalt transporter CbiM [Actinomycetota bacterium]
MHIPDGILPASVVIGGYAVAGGATWLSLDRIKRKYENPRELIPTASLLTAVFFVASLIHIPMPPTSVHLVLCGLMGVVLGWYAFPAILVGLFFQAVMFQHGGLTTLGVNACVMGLPALLAYGIFRLRYRFGGDKPAWSIGFGFLAGFLGLALGALMSSLLLILTIPANLDVAVERAAIISLLVAHMPLAVLEGVFTGLVVFFLQRVRPELLEAEIR